jgi:hypothetical protein
MFDPTAFENLKVVIEGAIYDKDLAGEILVTDRNDLLNLAKLQRKFEISFIDQNSSGNRITAIFSLEANLENLAAELLPSSLSEELSGCQVCVKFTCTHPNDPQYFQRIYQILTEIWGIDRAIEQLVQVNPLKKLDEVKNHITISFNRLVYEEQIHDLTDMVDYMITSMKRLREIYSF